MIATQFFYTVAFILTLVAFALSLLFALCCGPDQPRYGSLIGLIGLDLLIAGTVFPPLNVVSNFVTHGLMIYVTKEVSLNYFL